MGKEWEAAGRKLAIPSRVFYYEGAPKCNARAPSVSLLVLAPTFAMPSAARRFGLIVVSLLALPLLASPTRAQEEAPRVDSTFFKGLKYRMIGPYRGGRSTAVTGYPNRPSTFLMGTTGGGVWRTDDAGASWTNLSDGDFGGGMGAVDVSRSAPDVIYAGTGSACIRGNISTGRGMYKSEDGGRSWKFVGLEEAGQIGDIQIHPNDPDRVYAAALGHPFGKNEERGVYRSTDGGDSWEKVLYASDSTGAVDLAMNPDNPREIYASMWHGERKPWVVKSGSRDGGIYKTTDGGDHWHKLKGGLPGGLVGKSAVTVSPAEPDRVWALIEAKEPEGGVYRSDDAGRSWQRVNRSRKLRQRAYYYIHIQADPQDPNTVYALNTGFYKSIDGGESFEGHGVPHGDVHDLWINPNDPQKMVVADDGGAQVSLNGAKSWSTYKNQPTAEMYSVTVDNQFPYRVYGPQQDNSTISVPNWNSGGVSPKQFWFSVGGCESGPVALDPDDPSTIYAGCYGGVITRYDRDTEQMRNVMVYPQLQLGQAPRDLRERFQWVSPIEVSPQNPDVIYHASQHIFRSDDRGMTWKKISPDLTTDNPKHQDFGGAPITHEGTGTEVYGTVFALTPSPHAAGTLWAGTDDGRIQITRNGGNEWTDITPEDFPEGATVNRIEVSPHRAGEAFVAVYRYREDDFSPYLFHTTDYGDSWEQLADGENGIPGDYPVRVVREDPERKGLLYAGTEFGLFLSFDGGEHWQPFQRNLPVTPVTDLKIRRGDLVVATQGRSFWVMDDLTPLRRLTDRVRASDRHLFRPEAAIRTNASPGGSAPWPEGPPNGAIIDYYFDEAPDTTVTLEILNTDGEVLRRFSSDSTEIKHRQRVREKEEMENESFETEYVKAAVASKERFEGEPFVREEEGPLPVTEGLNRFVWNLRTPGIPTTEGARIWGYTGGIKVPPGRYRARLATAGGEGTQTKPFTVRADPRLTDVTTEDLQEQFRLARNIGGTLTDVYDAIRTLRSVRAQLKDVATRGAKAGYSGALLDDASALVDRIDTLEQQLIQTHAESLQDVINYPPRLDNQLAYLYGYVAGPEGRPTAAARTRYRDLKAQWQPLRARFQSLMNEGVADFNTAIEEAGMPPVTVRGAF